MEEQLTKAASFPKDISCSHETPDEPEPQSSAKELMRDDEEATPPSRLQTKKDVLYWSLFGRRGYVQERRSTRRSGQTLSGFTKPHALMWDIALSASNLNVLLVGFTPVEMEDKWFIYADGPDASGAATVHFHRSWTGMKVAELSIQISWGEDDAAELWSGTIVKCTIETDLEDPLQDDSVEEDMKFQVVFVCAWVLNIYLADEIEEPESWKALSKVPIDRKPVSEDSAPPRYVYKSVPGPCEAMEDLERVKGIPRDCSIIFTGG